MKRHDEFSAQLKGMLVCAEDEQPKIFNLAAIGAARSARGARRIAGK